MKPWLRLLLLASLASAAQAVAAGNPAELKRDFDSIDGDGDAHLSWSEFESRVMEVFYFADVDSNGFITPDQAPQGMAGSWKDIDSDGDGRLSTAEFVEHHRSLFSDADTDGDKLLSRAEMDALPGSSAAR